MIEIPTDDGGSYCIDRTEVTVLMYAEFLDVQAGLEDQDGVCAFNENYTPETSGACPDTRFDPDARPSLPVTCVDWCDAEAYCNWAGKRLCGSISGGPSAVDQHSDAADNQWFRACSEGGAREFPYGDVYDGDACVGLDYSATRPTTVGDAVNCRGGYAGLFDMSGNVSEWEDACDAAGACAIRGGNYFSQEESGFTSRCDGGGETRKNARAESRARSERSQFVGFRCCADL